MSFLAWAFAAGLFAVGFPILFHLIRRAPRGQQVFSSLMFLEASPPRLTRRSRLDDWLLLLLRTAALILLALAFMRPFVREKALLGTAQLPARRVAILVDTSASMRRGDLWTAARDKVSEVLEELEPGDDVALFTFDDRISTLVDFESQTSPALIAAKKGLIEQTLAQQTPGWRPTDLGRALLATADRIQTLQAQTSAPATLQVVVVSDLQRGSDLQALQSSQWPAEVPVDLRSVAPAGETNAAVRLLAPPDSQAAGEGTRLRITNAAGSTRQQFELGWAQGNNAVSSRTVSALVPPGSSQTLTMTREGEELAADQIVLRGDDADFDNRFYCIPLQPIVARVVYWGTESPDDPEGMLYYLQRALVDSPLRKVEFITDAAASLTDAAGGSSPALVFVTSELDAARVAQLQAYVADGGTVFVALQNAAQAAALQPLLGPVDVPADALPLGREYALLVDLDFAHPLLQPLAAPQFNDFTKIRFWQTTPIAQLQPTDRRIANFDDGRPAWWEVPQPRGAVYCLAASWSPAASQFALSSKFVTIMNALLDRTRPVGRGASSCRVGDPLPLPDGDAATTVRLTAPDGSSHALVAGDPPPRAEMPGIYRLDVGDSATAIAANLSAAESDIAPLPAESLKALGVAVGRQPPRAVQLEQLIRLKDLEFEGRQKIWKWLLVAAIVAAIAETMLAGRRQRATPDSAVPPSPSPSPSPGLRTRSGA